MVVTKTESVRKEGQAYGNPPAQVDYRSFRDMNRILCVEPSPYADRSRFAWHLAVYFPETARGIDEDDFGVLHLEVGVLKLASQAAIAAGDWDLLERHYSFVRALREHCSDALRAALDISYLGNLLYGKSSPNYAKARALLPPSLACALEAVEKHYEALAY
jgi:hypothetical protein